MWDRREKILAYILEKGEASITELASLFSNVSTMTIRRDLEYLEESGDIVRTKGGAKSIMRLSMRLEAAYHQRELINAPQKHEIAEKAAPLIENGSTVYFDAGSTVMHLVPFLGEKKIFAVTNGPNIAMELLKHPHCEVSMTSGRLNRQNISLSGLGATQSIEGINIGTAIMAASGFTPDLGFTCGSYDEAALKRAVISAAKRVVLVMDSTKLGRNHTFTFATPADIDIFVTDSAADKTMLVPLEEANIQLI